MCGLRLQGDRGVEVSTVRLRPPAWAFDDQQPSGLPAWYVAHDHVEAVIPGLIRIDVSGQDQVSCRILHEYDGIHLAGWRRRVIDRTLQVIGQYAKRHAPDEVQRGHAAMPESTSHLIHPQEILGR